MSEAPAKLLWNGKEIELPVVRGSENEYAIDISKLRAQTGLITLDYGFMNTGSTESAITFIDGDLGILRYRGYDIEDLAEQEHPSFLETAWLVIYGELPTVAERDEFSRQIRLHTLVHEDVKRFYYGFPKDAHPMATTASVVNALATFYQDSRRPARSRSDSALDRAADGEAPHRRGVLVQAVDRPAVPLPRQLPRPHRELPPDDVRGAVGAVRGVADDRARAQAAADPARRPRAELLHVDRADGRFRGGEPLRVDRGRGRRAVGPACTAARTRRASRCSRTSATTAAT